METIEEERLADELTSEEADLLMEAWPLPPEDTAREFEEYLMEIGLRL